MTLRLPFESPAVRDETLSCYLDGELDLDERLDLDTWLASHSEDRLRLERLRSVISSLNDLIPSKADLPSGWTLRAYRAGLPVLPFRPQKLGVWATEALVCRRALPMAIGHSSETPRRCVNRRRVGFHLPPMR